MAKNKQPTAAIIVIGNEILTGRTKDKNIEYLSENLTNHGIKLIEARIIRDDHNTIVSSVRKLSKDVDFVFTSGGIGPTHDDITTEAIADAFSAKVETNKEALRRLKNHYKGTGIELNKARLRMANIPVGSKLIDNPVSAAPGFKIDNVIVMAGVPKIMQAMFENVILHIKGGPKIFSVSIGCPLGEGNIAEGVSRIEKKYNSLEIGCYPWFRAGIFGTSIVARSIIEKELDESVKDLKFLIKKLGAEPYDIT